MLDYDEIISFLRSAMNYDEMNIWLLRMSAKGIDVSLDESLSKFFELVPQEKILSLYDVHKDEMKKVVIEEESEKNDDAKKLVKRRGFFKKRVM